MPRANVPSPSVPRVPPANAPARERTGLPVALAVLTLLATGVPLMAAALNIRWGGDGVNTGQDSLALSWLYANLGLGAVWFVAWPALLFRRLRRPPNILGDMATILVCSIPAFSVAGWLSDLPAATLLQVLWLHVSFALLTIGTLNLRSSRTGPNSFFTALLGSLYLFAPLVAYLQNLCLPGLPAAWQGLVPAIALNNASAAIFRGGNLYSVAITYALAGIVLLAIPSGHHLDHTPPAPSRTR